jgi:hypothetical protein
MQIQTRRKFRLVSAEWYLPRTSRTGHNTCDEDIRAGRPVVIGVCKAVSRTTGHVDMLPAALRRRQIGATDDHRGRLQRKTLEPNRAEGYANSDAIEKLSILWLHESPAGRNPQHCE